MAGFTDYSSSSDFVLFPDNFSLMADQSQYTDQYTQGLYNAMVDYQDPYTEQPVQQQQYFTAMQQPRAQDPRNSLVWTSPADGLAQPLPFSADLSRSAFSTSSESGTSNKSATSSVMGSPMVRHPHPATYPMFQDTWAVKPQGLGIGNTMVYDDAYTSLPYATSAFDQDALAGEKLPGSVDPSLINLSTTPMSNTYPMPSPQMYTMNHSGSPLPSPHPVTSQPRSATSLRSPRVPSPYLSNSTYPYTVHRSQRAPSSPSHLSSHSSPASGYDDDRRERRRCPFSDCGKVFKDLKAHILTHQQERPEKCPIANCDYHIKGFARKYDKNRHTLTHYKGTMVCGFCPGSGSSAEKSFNRADVFKKHLTSVHGVEQNPPNSRRKSPTASLAGSNLLHSTPGKCSTCGDFFANPQDLYEHLDDCVLRIVQQAEPSEAINEQLLQSVAEDQDVLQTLERNLLPPNVDYTATINDEDEEEDDEASEAEQEPTTSNSSRSGRGSIRSRKDEINSSSRNSASHVGGGIQKPTATGRGRPGMTHSKGGVSLCGKGRKKRKDYPVSWGRSPDKMKMKKRVLVVFDGQRRLWKDDMMLDNEFEVRMQLPDGGSYVTDLDVETIKRANALQNATAEERGPWIQDYSSLPPVDLAQLMAA